MGKLRLEHGLSTAFIVFMGCNYSCMPLIQRRLNWTSFEVRTWISNHIHGLLIRYAKLRVAHAPGMPERFPRHRLQRKPQVSDPGMHHVTCVTHVPWCMSGSLIRVGGENVPGIPGAWATHNIAYLARDALLYVDMINYPCHNPDVGLINL